MSTKDYKDAFANKDLIICDLDGTLIDSVPLYCGIDSELIKKIAPPKYKNLKMFDQETFWNEVGRNDMYNDLVKRIKEYCHSELSFEEIMNLREEQIYEIQVLKMRYKRYADEFLKTAKKEGYKLALATNTVHKAIDRYSTKNKVMMSSCILKEMFDYIITSEDVVKVKPSSEMHYKILNHFNIYPSQAICLEDTVAGTLAAVNCGIDVVCIHDEKSDKDREYLNGLSLGTTDFKSLIHALKK